MELCSKMKLSENQLIAILRSEEKMKHYLLENEKEPSKIDPAVWKIHFLIPPKKQMTVVNTFLDNFLLKLKRSNCFLPDHMVLAKIYKMLKIPYKISPCVKSPFKDYIKVTVSAKKSNHLSRYVKYYNIDLKSTKKSDFGIYDFDEEECSSIIPFTEFRKRLRSKNKIPETILRDIFDNPANVCQNPRTETSIFSKTDAKKHATFDRLPFSATLKSKFEHIESAMPFNLRSKVNLLTCTNQKLSDPRDESFIEFTSEENSPEYETIMPKQNVNAKSIVSEQDCVDRNTSEEVRDDRRTDKNSESVTFICDSRPISTGKLNGTVDKVVPQTIISVEKFIEEVITLDKNRTRKIVNEHNHNMISDIRLGSSAKKIETISSSSSEENIYSPYLPASVSPTRANGVRYSEDEDSTSIKVICSSNYTPVYIDDVTSNDQTTSAEAIKSINPACESDVNDQHETSPMIEIQQEFYGEKVVDDLNPLLMSSENLSLSSSSCVEATSESKRSLNRIGEACKIVVSQESRTFIRVDSSEVNSTPSPRNQNRRILEYDENAHNLRSVSKKRKLFTYAEDDENKENARSLQHRPTKPKRTIFDYKENIQNSRIGLIKSLKECKSVCVKEGQNENLLLKLKETQSKLERDTENYGISEKSYVSCEQGFMKNDKGELSPRNLHSNQEKLKLTELVREDDRKDSQEKCSESYKLLRLVNDDKNDSPQHLRNRPRKPKVIMLGHEEDKDNRILEKRSASYERIGLANDEKSYETPRNLRSRREISKLTELVREGVKNKSRKKSSKSCKPKLGLVNDNKTDNPQNLRKRAGKPKVAELSCKEDERRRILEKSPANYERIGLANDDKNYEIPRNLRNRRGKSKLTELVHEGFKKESRKKSSKSCKIIGLVNNDKNDSSRNLRNRPRKPKAVELGGEKDGSDRILEKNPASCELIGLANNDNNYETPPSVRNRRGRPKPVELGLEEDKGSLIQEESHANIKLIGFVKNNISENPRNLRNQPEKPKLIKLGQEKDEEDQNLGRSHASYKLILSLTEGKNVESSRNTQKYSKKPKRTILNCDENRNNSRYLRNSPEKRNLKNMEDKNSRGNSCTSQNYPGTPQQTIPGHEDYEGSLLNSTEKRKLGNVKDEKLKQNPFESASGLQELFQRYHQNYENGCSFSNSPEKRDRSTLRLSSKNVLDAKNSRNMRHLKSRLQIYEFSDSDDTEHDISKMAPSASKVPDNLSSPVRSMEIRSIEKTNKENFENASSQNASQIQIYSDSYLDQNNVDASKTLISPTDENQSYLLSSTKENVVLSPSKNTIHNPLGAKIYLDSDSDGNICASQKSKLSSDTKSTNSYASIIHSEVENEENSSQEKSHLPKRQVNKLPRGPQLEILLHSPIQNRIHFSDSKESQIFAPEKISSQKSYSQRIEPVPNESVQKKKTKAETKAMKKLTDFLDHKILKNSKSMQAIPPKIQGSTLKGQRSLQKLLPNSVDEIFVSPRKHERQPKSNTSPAKTVSKLSHSIQEEISNSDNDSISNGFKNLSLESNSSIVLFSEHFRSRSNFENVAESTKGKNSPDLLGTFEPHNSLDEITFDHINEMIKNVPKPSKNGNSSSTDDTSSSDSHSGMRSPKKNTIKDSTASTTVLMKQSKRIRKRKERNVLHKKHEIFFKSDSSDEDSTIFRDCSHSLKLTSPAVSKNKEKVDRVKKTNELNGTVIEKSTSIHLSEIIIPPELCVNTNAAVKSDQSSTVIFDSGESGEIHEINSTSWQKLGFFSEDEYGSDELACNLDANLLQLGYCNDSIESNVMEEENDRESIISRDYDEDICRLRQVMSEVAVLNKEQNEISQSSETVIATRTSSPLTASWKTDAMNSTNYSNQCSHSINSTSSYKEIIWNSYPDSLETALTTAEEKLLEVKEQMMKQFPDLPLKSHQSSKDSDEETFFDFE